MDPVNSYIHLFKYLKQHISGNASQPHKYAADSAKTEKGASPGGKDIREDIATYISDINLEKTPKDEVAKKFVEAVLLQKLGNDLSKDPIFDQLVNRVSEVLQSDPATFDKLTKAIHLSSQTK